MPRVRALIALLTLWLWVHISALPLRVRRMRTSQSGCIRCPHGHPLLPGELLRLLAVDSCSFEDLPEGSDGGALLPDDLIPGSNLELSLLQGGGWLD